MANIYVEAKGPKGGSFKESLLPAVVAGYLRGLAVAYGSDAYHALLASVVGQVCLGILEEDALSLKNPCTVVEFGQTVAQIAANVTAGQALAVNAAGLLAPASYGQAVVAIALESQTYVSPGSFANVFVVALLGIQYNSDAVSHVTVAGAIPVLSGTYGIGSGGVLAMTLAAPTNAQDGTLIYVVAQTAHAHTVTTPALGLNGATHIATFAAIGDGVELEAVGGTWMVRSIGGPTPAVIS